jgi:TolB-like protein/Tfp pilus assembly protein PilF
MFAMTLAMVGYLVMWRGDPGEMETWSTEETAGHIHAVSGSPPTIAILPFEVLGNDSGQRYLADGLTADITADLSRFSGLTVIGVWSTGTGAPSERPPLSAAAYRVWGGVQRNADRIYIHVVLIETATSEQRWSKRYDRPFSELLAVREEISRTLAEVLAVDTTMEEKRRLERRPTKSPAAYDLFLRAQANLLLRGETENRNARGLYRQAIDLDPAFARAYGGLALTYAADYRNRWTNDVEAALEQARLTANQAARLDPDLPEVLWVLGYVYVQERRHDKALSFIDRAIALDPSFADGYALKASLKTHAGAPEEAIPLLHRAMRLNPSSGYLYSLVLGRAYFFLGHTERAIANLREAIARNPTALQPHLFMAAAAIQAGEVDIAEWESMEILNLSPGFSLEAWLETYPMTDPHQREMLASSLAQIGLTR